MSDNSKCPHCGGIDELTPCESCGHTVCAACLDLAVEDAYLCKDCSEELFSYGGDESCDIDDGSLDGLSVEQAFVLGVEWHTTLMRMQRHRVFLATVHRSNVSRLEALAARRGYVATATQSREPTWVDMRFLKTKPAEGEGAR